MKILLSILVCLISLKGYNQTAIQPGAADYFVSASEKADSGDYSGSIGDLAKVISIDSGYVKAYFHWFEELQTEVTIASIKRTIRPHHTLVVSVVHPNPEVSRMRKDSKIRYMEYNKALEKYNMAWRINPAGREMVQLNDSASALYIKYQESLRKIKVFTSNIELDITLPGFRSLDKLFYSHWDKKKYYVEYSNKARTGLGPNYDSWDQSEYTEIRRQLIITPQAKEFREALIMDNDSLISRQKPE